MDVTKREGWMLVNRYIKDNIRQELGACHRALVTLLNPNILSGI